MLAQPGSGSALLIMVSSVGSVADLIAAQAKGDRIKFLFFWGHQPEAAQHRWRGVNAPHLVALVRAGARFDRGSLVERPTGDPANTMTAAA
jgi:hypothetical protein